MPGPNLTLTDEEVAIMVDALKSVKTSVTKYRVPKGVPILVHKTWVIKNRFPGNAKPAHFETIVTSKVATYTWNDVCLSPESPQTLLSPAIDYGVGDSMYYRDQNYYGFRLPTNSKGTEFILVGKRDVEVIPAKRSVTESVQKEKVKVFDAQMKKVMDEILKKEKELQYRKLEEQPILTPEKLKNREFEEMMQKAKELIKRDWFHSQTTEKS